MNSTLTESDEALALQDLRIVLIGRSEAGKSSIGNVILGREAFKESRTRESEIQRGRAEDRNISIIDTPGFFNTHLTDEELQNQMMKSLDLCSPGPHVFLLIIRLDRFTEDVGKTIKTIRRHFGNAVFKFTMVLFTGREAMSKREWIEFRLDRKTRELLSFCEEKCHVLIHKNKRDKKQIDSLLENIDEVVRKNGREHYVKDEKEEMEVNQKKEDTRADLHAKEVEMENSVQKEQTATNDREKRSSEENQINRKFEICLIEEEKKAELEDQSIKVSNLRIVLLGKSGSGKSSTGNTILRRDAFKINRSLHPIHQTCEKQEANVCGRNISLINTPSVMSDQTRVESMTPGPHVFLLVIRLDEMISDQVKRILENFGEEAPHYTIILFTHADQLKGKPIEEYIRENNPLQAIVDSFGGRFHSFNNKDTENSSQVNELMEKIEKMVERNGGKHYTIDNLKYQEDINSEKEENDKESSSNWLKGVIIFLIGALAAAAVAQSGLEG